jgi:hypothetical protein
MIEELTLRGVLYFIVLERYYPNKTARSHLYQAMCDIQGQ